MHAIPTSTLILLGFSFLLAVFGLINGFLIIRNNMQGPGVPGRLMAPFAAAAIVVGVSAVTRPTMTSTEAAGPTSGEAVVTTEQTSQRKKTVIVRDASGEVVGAWRGAKVRESLTKTVIWADNGEKITISQKQLIVSQVTETDAEWEARGLAEGWQAQGDEGGM